MTAESPAGNRFAEPAGGPDGRDEAVAASARASRNRAIRWAAVLFAILTTACTAACAGPPSKGDVHSEPLNQSRNNVVILAREPTRDMAPQVLVANFLQALTGDQKDPAFTVAQEYLTPGARAKWFTGPTWVTTTKIVDYTNPFVDVQQEPADHGTRPASASSPLAQPAAPAPALGDTKNVTVSGTELGEIDPDGFFRYMAPQLATQPFTVKYLGAETGWRIDTPPDFRMVNPEAFKRAYETYQSPLAVYLPSPGDAIPHVDQVYLTQATGKVEDTYAALVRAVLHGRYPSQDTHMRLDSMTIGSDGVAHVKLKAPPSGPFTVTDVQRALALTFQDAAETPQLVSPAPLTQVQVTYPGCDATCHSPSGIGPVGAQTPTVFWVCPQQNQNGTTAAIVSRPLVVNSSTVSAVCPANGAKVPSVVAMSGVRLEKDSPMAVKQTTDSSNLKAPSSTTTVAVVANDGSVVVLNDKNSDQKIWYTAVAASKVTDLEWDPVDGSLWVVDAGSIYRVPVPDPGNRGVAGDSQQTVMFPGGGSGSVTRFKPSPDGLRAVVVTTNTVTSATASTSAGSPPAAMVTIDRTGDVPTLSADTEFQLLAGPSQTGNPQIGSVTLQGVLDATWADGRTVVLLGTQLDSRTQKLYKVYLDGSQDSTIREPDDAQPAARHVGAATGIFLGHPAIWTFSDAPGPGDGGTTYSYFKRSGGSDSFQEVGSSPVIATVTAN